MNHLSLRKFSIIQDDGEVTKEDSGIIIVDKETKGAEENPQSAETSISVIASDLLPTSSSLFLFLTVHFFQNDGTNPLEQ